MTFCRYRFGHELATTIGNALLNASVSDMIRVTAEDERQAWLLMLGRPDQRYSFTDCTSFALIRRLSIRTVVALDQHFRTERFEVLPAV